MIYVSKLSITNPRQLMLTLCIQLRVIVKMIMSTRVQDLPRFLHLIVNNTVCFFYVLFFLPAKNLLRVKSYLCFLLKKGVHPVPPPINDSEDLDPWINYSNQVESSRILSFPFPSAVLGYNISL